MRKTLCLCLALTLLSAPVFAQQAATAPQEPELTLPASPVAPYVVPLLVLGAMVLFTAAAQD